MPLDDPDYEHTLAVEGLEEGRDYEVIITSRSGFYRYKMRDAIHCVGHKGAMPTMEFLYRIDQTVNMHGEKTTEMVLRKVVALVLQVAVACVLWSRKRAAAPATLLDKMMYLSESFQADWQGAAAFSCRPNMGAVVACSEQVTAWCGEQGVDGRRTYLISLAVEDLAGNTVTHDFAKTKHPAIDVKLILKRDGTLVLCVRDNGGPFNPMDLDLSATDPCAAVGIRMLRQGVRGVEYQYALGLNNVVVTLPASV